MTKTIKKPKADYKARGVSYPYPELEEGGDERILWPLVVSLLGHIVILAVLMFVPQPSFEKSYAPTVISVRMVSMGDIRSEAPGSETAALEESAPAPEPEPEPQPEPKAEPEPAPVEEVQKEPELALAPPEPEATAEEKSPPPTKEPEPEVSLAPKEKAPEKPEKKPEAEEEPKVKKSLKKKTYKPSEIVKNAIEKLEKETEQPRPRTVLEAIEKLRKDVAENPRKARASEKTANAGGGGNSAGGGRQGFGGASGSVMGGMFDVYKVEIAYQIQRNWAFSEQLARGRRDLEVLVGIKILPDGRIEDVWFDKKSGNQYLDDSAIRAVKKSNPLPPLPKGFRGRFLKTGLRFTPEGVGG